MHDVDGRDEPGHDDRRPFMTGQQYALYFPFSYASEELPDLGRSIERGAPDPEHRVDQWARSFLDTHGEGPPQTLDILARMTQAIHANFYYGVRHEEGVQLPADTIAQGSGSCRDFAFLMMEAVRSLGLAARFVSGYLYAPISMATAMSAAVPPMPGCRSICPEPAGSSSIRPTALSAIAT